MLGLSQSQLQRLAGYKERREGHVVPGTRVGMVYEYACWNWALTGGVANVNDPRSAMVIWEDIIQMDIVHEPPRMTGIKEVQNNYPGSAAEFEILNREWRRAQQGAQGGKNAFKEAMLRIAARKSGLTPLPGHPVNPTYTLHMKTNEWESWHHMGIGIKVPYWGGKRQTIVQTVPNHPVVHGCSVIWDEHMAETVIAIQELLPKHVEVLNRVQEQCFVCEPVPEGIVRSKRGWHRCLQCFAVFCRPHTTGRCSRNSCGGLTHLLTP